MATKRYFPVLTVIGLLAVAGLAGEPIPSPRGWEDKACHAVGFLAFALALRAAAPRSGWALAFALAVAFGGTIELVQMVVPMRTASWADLGADMAGFALGWLLSLLALGGKPLDVAPPVDRS